MNICTGLLKIKSIETIARETKKFIFSSSEVAKLDGTTLPKLDFKAGQFISIQFRDNLARAYSIASAPHEDKIELIIRIIPNGAGSMIIDQANVGNTFPFKGPFGHFVLSNTAQADLFFCATGTGIAPIRSMILTENQSPSPRAITLFYGGRDQADLAYLEEMEKWTPNLKIRLGLSRETDKNKQGPYGEHCRITKFLEENKYNENAEFYICGNGAMVKSVVEILTTQKIPKNKIFMERFN